MKIEELNELLDHDIIGLDISTYTDNGLLHIVAEYETIKKIAVPIIDGPIDKSYLMNHIKDELMKKIKFELFGEVS